MASGAILSVLKEALVELTIGWTSINIWLHVAEIMGELLLGLDMLHTNDAFVDLGHHMLRLGKEVSVWSPQAWP
jgi:hypothetical protein